MKISWPCFLIVACFLIGIACDDTIADVSTKVTNQNQCTDENYRLGLCKPMNVKRESRSPLEAIVLQIGIRCKYAYGLD